MEIKVLLPSALEAENMEFDKARGILSFKPLFYDKGQHAQLGHISVVSNGREVFRAMLKVSGYTGKVTAVQRTNTVTPPIDRGVTAPGAPKPKA